MVAFYFAKEDQECGEKKSDRPQRIASAGGHYSTFGMYMDDAIITNRICLSWQQFVVC